MSTEPQQTQEEFIQVNFSALLTRYRLKFKVGDNFTDEEILGSFISKFFKWIPDQVFDTFYAALVDVNFEDFAEEIKKLWQTPEPTNKTKAQKKYEALKTKYKVSIFAYRAEEMKMCLNDFIADIDVIYYQKDKDLLIHPDNDLYYANFISGLLKLELDTN